MVDCFYRLGHYAVVCRNNQNCNIGRIRAAHTHCSERFMSGCIQEGNRLTIDLYGVRTNMLRDASCLAVCYIRLTDRIQQGGFTVVNVTHNTDDRRSGNHILVCFLILF